MFRKTALVLACALALSVLAMHRETVFLGDSLTAWWNIPAAHCINKGQVGNTTADLRRRFPRMLRYTPRRVVVLGGTNDFWKAGTSVSQAECNLGEIYSTATRLHIRPVAATVPPVARTIDRSPAINAEIAALNSWIRADAQAHGYGLIDFYQAVSGADGYLRPEFSKDGVHLNDSGYAAVRPLVTAALRD